MTNLSPSDDERAMGKPGLTHEERERIRAFAAKHGWERTPDDLRPEESEESEEPD